MTNTTTLFDSHLHFNHEDFANDYERLWDEANQQGVTGAITIGYDLESSRRAITIAERLPGMFASVGVSPHDAQDAPDDYIRVLTDLASHPKVKAIGECGLEYHYPVGPKEMQIERFLEQAQIANDLRKVLVIHLRSADEDFLKLLESNPISSAILHCFTASMDVLHKAVSSGFYVSFSGILTFKSAGDIRKAALEVPLDQLLIETDSPYLAPVPYRGKRCEPRMIVETARALANLREITIEELTTITETNAKRAFQIACE